MKNLITALLFSIAAITTALPTEAALKLQAYNQAAPRPSCEGYHGPKAADCIDAISSLLSSDGLIAIAGSASNTTTSGTCSLVIYNSAASLALIKPAAASEIFNDVSHDCVLAEGKLGHSVHGSLWFLINHSKSDDDDALTSTNAMGRKDKHRNCVQRATSRLVMWVWRRPARGS